jgi:hypothetical protein
MPAPVARYFAFALLPGQPLVRTARLEWEGEFRLSPKGRWSPFRAEQHFTARPPAMAWDAAIRMAPLVNVRVRDRYLGGEGSMHVTVAGLVPVVDVHGTPEMAAGALARFLGESVWLPTALLPDEQLAWSAVDDGRARATLTDGAVIVSADFHFGPRGEVERVTGERYRDVDGRGVLTRWEGRLWDYERVHGVMVPRRGEVAWLLPEGPFAYWRGRLMAAEYALEP